MHRRNFLKGFLAATTIATLSPLAKVVELSTSQAKFINLDEALRTVIGQHFGQKPHIMNDQELEEFYLGKTPHKRNDLMQIRPRTWMNPGRIRRGENLNSV